MRKVLILGGGFGGVYTAQYLKKMAHRSKIPLEISLVSETNYFVFHPMLAEIVGGSIDLLDTVNPLSQLLPKVTLHIRKIESINRQNQSVTLSPKYSHQPLVLPYDELVIALGNVTDFREQQSIRAHALPFKSL
ncbi:MAG: FAD-dependent oxidoreductase, partial [Chlamydiota bacterium]|nr:FAD-dependent oxidoreductase [Chlamydiota bacterium]